MRHSTISNQLDLKLLATFITLVKECSTSRTAQRLNLAQSTVSGSLARLRSIFSDELLIRQGQALIPTLRALELSAEILPHYENLVTALETTKIFDPETDNYCFRLGCTETVALSLVPRLTEFIQLNAPHCQLSVQVAASSSLTDLIDDGSVLTVCGEVKTDLNANDKIRILNREPWCVVRCASAEALETSDNYFKRPHITVSANGALTDGLEDQFASEDRRRSVLLGVSNYAMLLNLLPGTDFVATVPASVADLLTIYADISVDPYRPRLEPAETYVAWSGVSHKDPAENWLRKAIIAVAKDDDTSPAHLVH